MKYVLFALMWSIVSFSYGAVGCGGVIKDVYKWDHFDTISVRIESVGNYITPWISLPTKSDESMALMAFTTGRPVSVYMSEDSVTECDNGWANNKKLKGYFIVQ